jgi:hypothetical protein
MHGSDREAAQGSGAAYEVDADGGDVTVCPLVILDNRVCKDSACRLNEWTTRRDPQTIMARVERWAHREAQQQARLSHARIPDEHKDEKVVVCKQRA